MREFGAEGLGDPPSTAEREPLAQLDELARLAIARVAPVRYGVAGSTAAREAVFRLRHRAVVERGWAAPDDLPDGLERDADDERAVLIGGWRGEELVAAARLIFPVPGRRLPVEAVFDLVVEPCGQIVHVDRVTVARAHSDPGSRVLLGLIGRCWLEMRERGFRLGAGIESPGVIRLFRLVGLDVTVLGPARRYWDEDRYPIRFDPTTAMTTIRSRRAPVASGPTHRP
ncbi:MAG TPA: hypothetical protein VH482_36350 [Thermomicrobiales bacterium]|jgi:hypothetical protein